MHYEIITDDKTPFERKLTIKGVCYMYPEEGTMSWTSLGYKDLLIMTLGPDGEF